MQHGEKPSFLQELYQKIQRANTPLMIGGDFNFIRYCHEKSSDNIEQIWMDMFNNFIADCSLRELRRTGSKYTWTNK